MSKGVYIKDMEMPKDIEPGLVIEFADGIDGKRYARLYHYRHGGLTEWLEALSVPPHGRLIDADALKDLYHYNTHDSDIDKAWTGNIRRSIDSAPTIIPAEEGE